MSSSNFPFTIIVNNYDLEQAVTVFNELVNYRCLIQKASSYEVMIYIDILVNYVAGGDCAIIFTVADINIYKDNLYNQ